MQRSDQTSGVIKGESHIAYFFDLPELPKDPETEEYLRTLSQRFLSFLQKESKKPCDYVRYAGLRFEREEDTLTLLAAFCPFEQRDFQAVAKLFFNEEGKLFRIQKEKRSRRLS